MQTQTEAPLGPIGALVRSAGVWWWGSVAAWTGGIYAICALVLPGALSADLSYYFVQPLLWLSVAALAWLGWRAGLCERPAPRNGLLRAALLIGLLQVSLSILASLLQGFVRSPYGHSLTVLLGNLLYAGTTLLGMEMARAYLIVVLGRRRPWLALGLVCLFLGLLSMPFGAYRGLASAGGVLQTAGGLLLPTLSESLLATLLAFLGGPVASIAYRGVLQAFAWLSPLLPNLSWALSAILGIFVPSLAFVIVYNRYAAQPAGESEARVAQGASSLSWLLVAAIAVGQFGLSTGVFGFRSTLIASGSMSPRLEVGDVVITQQVPPERVRANDIIRFRDGRVHVVHRVVEVHQDGDQITYITRGDANNTNDRPVPASALDGLAILTVPKVGWISIGLRQLLDRAFQ